MNSRKPGEDSLIFINTTTPLFHLTPLIKWDYCHLFLRMTLSIISSSLICDRHCLHLRLMYPGFQQRLSKCFFPACFTALALFCIYGSFITNQTSFVSSVSHLKIVFSLWTPATQDGIQTRTYSWIQPHYLMRDISNPLAYMGYVGKRVCEPLKALFILLATFQWSMLPAHWKCSRAIINSFLPWSQHLQLEIPKHLV